MRKTIYLIRHGEPGVKNGKKEGLTENGRNQIEKLAQRLVSELGEQADASIHYSPVKRCLETAEIISAKQELPIMEAPLRLQGADALTVSNTQSKLSQYLNNYQRLSIESPEAFTTRVLEYINSQTTTSVLLVGNEVPLRLLLQRIAKTGYNTTIKHGSCLKVTFVDGKSSVVSEIE